jgi:hypothetical protein
MDKSGADALSYAIAAAEDAANQVKLWTLYNNGIPPLPDHNWKITYYDHAGNYNVRITEEPDYSNITKDHYCFRLYMYEHWNKESWNEDEGFELWKESVTNPGLNNLFKMVYTWDIRTLVPDSGTLMKLIREGK